MSNILQTKFRECFPVPISIPDTAHLAQSLETLINEQMAIVAAGTAPQGQPFTMGAKEITTVVFVPAGPCHFFHSNIGFASRDFQISFSGVIASGAEFSGFQALDWWKTTKIYAASGDTGYGSGGLTAGIAYCMLS